MPALGVETDAGPVRSGLLDRADLLDRAFAVPDLRPRDLRTARPARVGERCALTGRALRPGETVVLAEALLTSASSAPHEIFPAAGGAGATHVSLAAARCYKHFRGGLTGNLLAIGRSTAEDGSSETLGLAPMISAASADAAAERGAPRPCWQRLLYGTDPHGDLRAGDLTLAVVTEEFQRRLWLDARLSRFDAEDRPANGRGANGRSATWSLYLYWTGTAAGSHARNVTVRVPRLRAVLTLCEYAYALGFSKDALLTGLLGGSRPAPLRTVAAVGFRRTSALDDALEMHRGTDELLVAACVVQRAPDPDEIEAPPAYRYLIPRT